MHLSISQLSELTGKERRTVAQKLTDVPYVAGEWDAMLYGISRGAAARLSLKDFIMDLLYWTNPGPLSIVIAASFSLRHVRDAASAPAAFR
jgi:hypothetical protein